MTSITKNLSQSLAPDGILVNTVSPGTFASESFKAALAPIPDLDENDLHDVMRYINENFGHHVFLERAADPSEIGPAIDRALASGVPALVNVLTDPADVYPRSSALM